MPASSASKTDYRRQEFYCEDEPLATFWRQSTPGTYYARCLVPARHLPAQVLGFKNTDLAERKGNVFFPRQRGAAIWQFPGNATHGTLMAGMQDEGFPVLIEVDDSYLHAPDAFSSGWQEDFDRNGRTDNVSRAAHRRLAGFADGIIVSTEALAELYGDINEKVFVCPNSVETEDWKFDSLKRDDGILRIGWAASHPHIVDAPLVRRALRWASRRDGVEVWIFGLGDVYRFGANVQDVPFTDSLDDYRRSLSLCDVLICPLIETEWSRYKSDIKALEAAMAGTWPIVSTATAYKPWHDRTLACTTAKDWEEAIRWAIRHPDEIPQLAAKARDYVLSERTIESSIGRWRSALASCGG